jgi:23S rRNA pseudouridine2605 synthase
MANKGKIPGKYTSNERRERNTKFTAKSKPRNIERKISGSKPPESMRLNKYIANSGVCSRREADTLIEKGEIKVNGNVVKEMGVTVSFDDKVEYQGKNLIPEKKVYLLLNKPKDTVTTSSDPEGRKTVIEIIRNACPQRVYPVGRLDRNTTGVLLLTNDGDLSKQLTHPSFEAKKIYHVFLNQPLAPEDLESIKNGVELEDGLVKPDAANYVDNDPMQAGIEIHSGKNRIVRRIFEHFDYKVEKLDRVYFAGLTKKNLPRGKWRFLSDKEVRFLKAELKTKNR